MENNINLIKTVRLDQHDKFSNFGDSNASQSIIKLDKGKTIENSGLGKIVEVYSYTKPTNTAKEKKPYTVSVHLRRNKFGNESYQTIENIRCSCPQWKFRRYMCKHALETLVTHIFPNTLREMISYIKLDNDNKLTILDTPNIKLSYKMDDVSSYLSNESVIQFLKVFPSPSFRIINNDRRDVYRIDSYSNMRNHFNIGAKDKDILLSIENSHTDEYVTWDECFRGDSNFIVRQMCNDTALISQQKTNTKGGGKIKSLLIDIVVRSLLKKFAKLQETLVGSKEIKDGVRGLKGTVDRKIKDFKVARQVNELKKTVDKKIIDNNSNGSGDNNKKKKHQKAKTNKKRTDNNEYDTNELLM